MIISEDVVKIDTTDDADAPNNKEEKQEDNNRAQTVKFDLRLDSREAERDFFKLCVISQIFSQP